MGVVLIELRRDKPAPDNDVYVLRCETHQHQITRMPTIITLPGKRTAEGKPRIIGYDIGIVSEQITLSGQVTTQDETVVVGDPAYDALISKVYPGKESLRDVALYWWADVTSWADPDGTGKVELWTPLGETYKGIIQSVQFTQEPARDIYNFSLVFRVAHYPVA